MPLRNTTRKTAGCIVTVTLLDARARTIDMLSDVVEGLGPNHTLTLRLDGTKADGPTPYVWHFGIDPM